MSNDCFECGDCGHTTENPSITGPIKEVDEDGRLQMNWAYLCPECFSPKLQIVVRIRISACM